MIYTFGSENDHFYPFQRCFRLVRSVQELFIYWGMGLSLSRFWLSSLRRSMSFSINLAKWAERAGEKADLVIKDVIIDVARRIDEKSPVGKREIWASNIERKTRGLPPLPKDYKGGHFRANWQLGVNTRPENEIDTTDFSGTVNQNIGRLPAQCMGNVFYLTNNVPYAMRLENGHSTQAPIGIVGITILEWQGIVRRNAQRARGA